MKKTILNLILALLMCSTFVLTASADTNTVDTPIEITFGQEITGTFPDGTFEHTFFYVFTATIDGDYQFIESDSSIKLTFYNYMDNGGTWGRGSVTTGSRAFEAGQEVRFAVAKNNVNSENDFAFTVIAPVTVPVAPNAPGDTTSDNILQNELSDAEEKWAIGGIWAILIFFGLPLLFMIVIFFPYKKYMINNYEFNPVGLPFLITMGMVAVVCVIALFGYHWMFGLWFLAIVMAPGFAAMTINLISKTKDIKIILINTVLMAVFFIVSAYAATIFTIVILAIIAVMIILGAGGMAMASGGRGGGGGSGGGSNTRTCSVCGKTLYYDAGCNCGGATSTF